MSSSSLLQSDFDVLLAKLVASFPPSGGLREAAAKRFQTEFSNPKCKELEFVLQKRVTEDEYRTLMFFPTPEQMQMVLISS